MTGAAQCTLALEPGCLPYAYRPGSAAGLGDASRRLENFLEITRPTTQTREDTTIRHEHHNANTSGIPLMIFVLTHFPFMTNLPFMTELQFEYSTTNTFLLIHESPLTDALFLLVSKSDEVTTT